MMVFENLVAYMTPKEEAQQKVVFNIRHFRDKHSWRVYGVLVIFLKPCIPITSAPCCLPSPLSGIFSDHGNILVQRFLVLLLSLQFSHEPRW